MACMNRGVKFHFKRTESAEHLTLHPQHRNKVTLIIQKFLCKIYFLRCGILHEKNENTVGGALFLLSAELIVFQSIE